MRILMIDHWSAKNMYSLELSKELANLLDLSLLTVDNSMLKDKGNFQYQKCLLGYGYKKGFRLYMKYLKSLIIQFRLVLSKKYDCVHVQSFRSSLIEIPLYVIFKPLINKLVITVHNVLPHEQKKTDMLLYRKIYKICDELIVHNNYTKNKLIELFNIAEEKIHVIPHGVYSSHLKKNNVNIIETQKSKYNILFFGLIRPYKGVDVLIKSLMLLPETYRNKLTVKIVGKNMSDISYKEMILKNRLNRFVNIVDSFIPENEIENYFNWADLVILPYKKISGSGALLMSYTFNKIVLTSDLPAFIEETNNGKTGYIFKSNDPNDLCKKIIDYLESTPEQRKEYRSNIKELIEKKYNWKQSALLTYNVYKG